MKWLAPFLSVAVSAVSSLSLAAAPIKNDGVLASLIIPDTYIITYKAGADAARRKQHEEDVHSRAKNASKQGMIDTFDIPGLQGYVAEIPPGELDTLRSSDLVGTSPPPHLSILTPSPHRSTTSNATPSPAPPRSPTNHAPSKPNPTPPGA